MEITYFFSDMRLAFNADLALRAPVKKNHFLTVKSSLAAANKNG